MTLGFAAQLFLKETLIQAKREDVFIHYNDGPGSGNLKGNGMCKGLDYFSIDSYRDDPAAEVAASKAAYASLIPKLNKPNTCEYRTVPFLAPALHLFVA